MKLDNLHLLKLADETLMTAIVENRGDIMSLMDCKGAVSMWIEAIIEDGDTPEIDDIVTTLCKRIKNLT